MESYFHSTPLGKAFPSRDAVSDLRVEYQRQTRHSQCPSSMMSENRAAERSGNEVGEFVPHAEIVAPGF